MIVFNNLQAKSMSRDNIGTTLDCSYIPIINLSTNDRIEDERIEGGELHFMYYSDTIYSSNNIGNYEPYSKVFRRLAGYYSSSKYTNKTGDFSLQVGHGYIIDTISGKYLLQVSVPVRYKVLGYNDISYSNITIFVSNEFLNPKYKLFYNRLYKEVLLPYLEIGTEVIFTTSEKIIEKNYSDISLSFSSIPEMERYLSEEVVKLLLPAQQSESQEEIEPSSESVDLPF